MLQNSLEELDGVLVDRTVAGSPHLTRFQFERLGYFCVDLDSTDTKVVGVPRLSSPLGTVPVFSWLGIRR